MKASFQDLKEGLIDYLRDSGSTVSAAALSNAFDVTRDEVSDFLENLHRDGIVRARKGRKGLEYFLPGSNVSAAKDTGTPKKDKDRTARLGELVSMADSIKEEIDLSGYPEVKAACDAVLKVKDMVSSIAELQIKLKAAPAGSEEAVQHQESLDALREGVDAMIQPLEATMDAMSSLLLAAVSLDEQFTALSEQVSSMEEKLKTDKDRLSSIAKAVEKSAEVAVGK